MFSDALRRNAAPWLRQWEALRTRLSADGEDFDLATRITKDLFSQTGWRERHLRGFFGGDHPLAVDYRRSRRRTRSARSRIQRGESKCERIAVRIDRLVEAELLAADPNYRHIVEAVELFRDSLHDCRVIRREIPRARAALRRALSSNVDVNSDPAQRLRFDKAVATYQRHAQRIKKAASALSQRMTLAKFTAENAPGGRAWRWADLDNDLVVRLPIEPSAGLIGRDELLRRVQALEATRRQVEVVAAHCVRSHSHMDHARNDALRSAHRLL